MGKYDQFNKKNIDEFVNELQDCLIEFSKERGLTFDTKFNCSYDSGRVTIKNLHINSNESDSNDLTLLAEILSDANVDKNVINSILNKTNIMVGNDVVTIIEFKQSDKMYPVKGNIGVSYTINYLIENAEAISE